MSFIVIIPARYGSSRLPGKPLLLLAGKPMVQHVYERAITSGADKVIIATDDVRIQTSCSAFDAEVIMTSADHPSGTDRLAEVVNKINCSDEQIIVNLQGDEPLMPATLVHQVAKNLAQHESAGIATLCEAITCATDLFDPHIVKVVFDKQGYALYFSRAVIPWDRDVFSNSTEELSADAEHYRHIGLYAYRAGFIKQYVEWPPCQLEQLESLEQLRALWNGARIHVASAKESPGHGIDTEKDLQRVEALFEKQK